MNSIACFLHNDAGDAPTGRDATPLARDDTALRSAETAALERENKLLREAVEDLRKALALADRLSLAAPIAAPGPVTPAEPEPRQSLLRYWFGWRRAGRPHASLTRLGEDDSCA